MNKDNDDDYYIETKHPNGNISIQSRYNGITLNIVGGSGFAKQLNEAFDKVMKALINTEEYINVDQEQKEWAYQQEQERDERLWNSGFNAAVIRSEFHDEWDNVNTIILIDMINDKKGDIEKAVGNIVSGNPTKDSSVNDYRRNVKPKAVAPVATNTTTSTYEDKATK